MLQGNPHRYRWGLHYENSDLFDRLYIRILEWPLIKDACFFYEDGLHMVILAFYGQQYQSCIKALISGFEGIKIFLSSGNKSLQNA